MPISEIEKLDALGREKGLVIYSVHQCNAGWGVQWYENLSDLPTPPEWRTRLVVYGYYKTIGEMIEAETNRVREWNPDAQTRQAKI